MDFEHSERAQQYIAQVERFVRERIVPKEQTYVDQLVHTDDWRQWRIPPILDELKADAKAAGLWNLFLPETEYGAGLDNRDYAPLAEITGRSFLAPEVFNCSAPDTDVQAVGPGEVQSAIRQVTETLARRHRIRADDPNDFGVRNLSQIAETAQGSSHIMALLLATVASISLVVGGIGIMNILLVSVTERTREIGLRMAIGARRLHVLLQFLAEAVFLSVSGGIAGILIGVALSKGISIVAGWPAPISLAAVAGGFLFSAAVGVFFGYDPARKAARLDPIEALRYE